MNARNHVRPLHGPPIDWRSVYSTALGIGLGALVTLVMVESYRLGLLRGVLP